MGRGMFEISCMILTICEPLGMPLRNRPMRQSLNSPLKVVVGDVLVGLNFHHSVSSPMEPFMITTILDKSLRLIAWMACTICDPQSISIVQ